MITHHPVTVPDLHGPHLRFLIVLHLVLIALIISAGLQSRYAWSVLVADAEYVIALMVIAFAASALYGWAWEAHGE